MAKTPQACNFFKKEPLAQVFSFGFCDIFKNIFLYRTPPVANGRVSGNNRNLKITWNKLKMVQLQTFICEKRNKIKDFV